MNNYLIINVNLKKTPQLFILKILRNAQQKLIYKCDK